MDEAAWLTPARQLATGAPQSISRPMSVHPAKAGASTSLCGSVHQEAAPVAGPLGRRVSEVGRRVMSVEHCAKPECFKLLWNLKVNHRFSR